MKEITLKEAKKILKEMRKVKNKIEGAEIFRSIEIINDWVAVEFATPFERDGDVVVEYNWSWVIAPRNPQKWVSWYKERLREEEECFK